MLVYLPDEKSFMTILCFGDSITYGNWDPKGGWVGRLREYLDSKSLENYSGNDLYSTYYTLTYNLGIPGETSPGLLERFETELAMRYNPDELNIILIAVGINDSRFYKSEDRHETDIDEFRQNIWDLEEIAKKYTNDVAFIGLTPVDESRTNPLSWEPDAIYKNEYIEKYDAVIKEFCTSRNIPFIDIFNGMKELEVSKLLEDGIHPNQEGHKVMEEIIRTAVFENRDI